MEEEELYTIVFGCIDGADNKPHKGRINVKLYILTKHNRIT